MKQSRLCAICVPLWIAAAAFAQSDRGTITGTVSDPAAAVIPEAKVMAKNIASGAVFETVTTATGNYTLASLPAGTYEVAVTANGFSRKVLQNIPVQVAQTLRLDVAMQVGTATESITVTEAAPLLRTENAEQSMNVSGTRINNLPLNFGGGGGSTGSIRSWLGFIQLAPGVSGTNERASINGAPGGSFKVMVEGQDLTSTNDTIWTSTVSSAAVEMIGEFSFQASNFSAEYGQTLGGVFNFTTKSGTNSLHGSAFEYLTNEALDARRPFSHARPISRKHDYGGTIGGPVWIPKIYNGTNKTFFFFNYEGFRVKTRSAGAFNTVPTAAMRTGDFSRALTGRALNGTDPLGRPHMENTIYDPLTTRQVNGVMVRDPFVNNIIPTSRLDPVALNIQKLFPNPDNGEIERNWEQNTASHKYQNIPAIKIDHALRDTIKTSFYYSVQNTDQISANDGLPTPITARRDQQIYGHTVRLNYDQSITPTLLLHLGSGLVRFHNPDSSPADVLEYDAVGNLGFRGAVTSPSGFPRITGLTGGLGGMLNVGPTNANKYYDTKLTQVASLTWVRNNHTFKLGGEWKLMSWTDYNSVNGQGSLAFNSQQTTQPSTQGVNLGGGSLGHGYASFLLGLTNTATVRAVQDPQWRKQSLSLYIQDTWKATRKLTVDYGLRWDYAGQGHEIHYRNSMFGPTIPNPAAGGLLGGIVYEGYGAGRCDCQFTDNYPYAIGPRLGLAYQIDEKTVLRAGWGITYSPLANWWYVTGGTFLGVGFDQQQYTSTTFAEPATLLKDGIAFDRARLYTPTLDPGLRPQSGQVNAPSGGYDRNGGRPGRVQQINVALQRELFRNLSLEAAYVANRGIWLEANSLNAVNAISESRLRSFGLDLRNQADRTLLTSTIGSQVAAQRGFRAPYAGYPTGQTVAQTLRPFPQFNNNLQPRWAPLGNSWYDSLQVKLTKRYSHGLDLSASFTWQKELALGTGNPSAGDNGLGGGINDPFNRQNQKSLTTSSQPLVLVIGFNYETPGLTTNRLVRRLTGNWNVGGVLRYASGTLIAVPSSNNSLINSYTFTGNTRMNRVPGEPLFLKDPGCGCIDPNKDFVLNPKAWADVGQGEWGYSAPFYDDYRWRRSVSESLSLGRSFRLREAMTFQVRAEFFNVFNRTILPNPTANNTGNNPIATPTFSAGVPTGGFGYFNPTTIAGSRNGQIVARFQF